MGSEIAYNRISAKVMAEHELPIHDMHGYVHALIDMDKPAGHGADPFFFDRKPLHPPIVRRILSELGLIRPVKGPVKLVIMLGGWSHIGGGIVFDANTPRAGQPQGTLDQLVLNNADYAHLLRLDGRWATRPDVWIHFDHRGPKSGVLGIGYGGDRKRGIGSELSLGHVLGNHFDEQVCIIKTTLGTPSLATDLRPPSSGETGKAYTTLITQIQDSLAHLRDKFPDYTDDAGYEFAGLVINLGEQDDKPELYAEYLPLLIKDLRKELKTPDLPVAIVGTGLGGREAPEHPAILAAQQAMAGASVAFVETRDFWPAEDARTPSRHAPHAQWYCNAESFYKVGQAIGREMLKLLK
jgi:alpha-galactosidase